MIEVIDDLVPPNIANSIEEQSLDPTNIWNLDKSTIVSEFEYNDKNIIENYQFRSIVKHFDQIPNQKAYNLVLDICKQLRRKLSYNFLDPYRIKYNLLPQIITDYNLQYHTPHVDSDIDHYVILYYVNDSDGPTYIFNETRQDFDMDAAYKTKQFTIKETVEPKKGRLIIFDGNLYHTSSSPTLSSKRTVLNINFHKSNVLI